MDIVIHLVTFAGVTVLVLLTPLLLAPFESLRWWMNQQQPAQRDAFDPSLDPPEDPPADDRDSPPVAITTTQPDDAVAAVPPVAPAYVVYLSGIGDITGEALAYLEVAFLDAVRARVPGIAIIDDIFPYSVTNVGLTGNRTFAGIWRWLAKHKRAGNPVGELINARNAFQVLVSADWRYGPIYSYGMAELIVERLLARGYPLGSGMPVLLIGYSGGGQVSLGASTYLQPMLGAPLRLVSLAGVMSSDPGVGVVEHLYHLIGSADSLKGAHKVFPGRWSITRESHWNQAMAQGRITIIDMGAMEHAGEKGYLGNEVLDGTPHWQRTLDTIVPLITDFYARYGTPLLTQAAPPIALPVAPAANGTDTVAAPAAPALAVAVPPDPDSAPHENADEHAPRLAHE